MTANSPQITETVLDKTRPATCSRCKGSGEFRGYGMCYGCHGTGIVYPHQITRTRPMTAEEIEYEAGISARERREAERQARRAAR